MFRINNSEKCNIQKVIFTYLFDYKELDYYNVNASKLF
jgi:hypothetical protein